MRYYLERLTCSLRWWIDRALNYRHRPPKLTEADLARLRAGHIPLDQWPEASQTPFRPLAVQDWQEVVVLGPKAMEIVRRMEDPNDPTGKRRRPHGQNKELTAEHLRILEQHGTPVVEWPDPGDDLFGSEQVKR